MKSDLPFNFGAVGSHRSFIASLRCYLKRHLSISVLHSEEVTVFSLMITLGGMSADKVSLEREMAT